MKLKEVSLFKAVNISMAIFCFGSGSRKREEGENMAVD